eukprot:scaffold88_cov387-Prasinococcus_capsulatus_cf.AAC.1
MADSTAIALGPPWEMGRGDWLARSGAEMLRPRPATRPLACAPAALPAVATTPSDRWRPST